MRNIRPNLLIFFGLMIFLNVQAIFGASDTPAPYIYYYANPINAIVVERADGTDSRVIAPGAMPADNSVIDDLDWSPSGEWMAWRSGLPTEGGAHNFQGWIAHSDGELLDDLGGNVLKIEWSPIHDYLFVAQGANESQLRLMIIDPVANKIIAETTYDSDRMISPYEFVGGWLENGDEVYFGYDLWLITLTLDNRVQTTLYEDLPVPHEKFSVSQVIDLHHGRLFYFDERGDSQYDAVLEDIQTGKRVVIDEAANLQTNYEVHWNPGMTHALIVRQNCPKNACASAVSRLLDWRTSTVAPLDDMTPIVEDTFEGITPIWSPDSRFLIAVDSSIPSLVIVDMDTRKAIPLPASSYWQWGDPHTLFLLGYQDKVIYHYDADKNKLDTFDVLPEGNYYSIWPSPNNMLIGVYNSLLHHRDIINLNTGESLTLPPHSLGTYGAIFATYTWGADSQWFFSNEHISFAGGGGGPEARTIINLDGTVRRELGVCFCAFGLLPDRVVPYLGNGSPISVIQQPEYTLPHDGKVTGVAWSPDGSKIVSYTLNPDYGSGGKLTVWDVSGTPELITTYNAETDCGQREFSCRLAWRSDGKTIRLNNDSMLEVWDVEADQHTVTDFSQNPLCNTYQVMSPDGLLIACVANIDNNMSMSIVDTSTGLPVATIAHQWGRLSWSSDSKTLFLENDLALWNAGEIQTHEAPTEIYSAAARPTNRYKFEASFYHRINVWNATTGEPLRDLNWYATTVALSPDGTRLAAVGSSLVTIWDVSDLAKKDP